MRNKISKIEAITLFGMGALCLGALLFINPYSPVTFFKNEEYLKKERERYLKDTSELRKKELDNFFKIYDKDNNNVIDRTEYTKYLEETYRHGEGI